MIDPNSAEPDITLILDHAGVIQQAVAGPSIAGEAISDWIGQPWADTVRDHERSGIGRLVEHARRGGVSGIGQVAQRFPSGLVLPLEYTTVRLGDTGGLVAVGRQPHAVTQLQTRLLDAQHVLEQDYWKLRAVETRYRMLLDSAQDALLTLTPETLRIVEINPPAARLLGAASENAQDTRAIDLIALLADADRRTLNDIVMRAQKHGMSNGLLQHIGDRSGPWLVRASSIPSGPVPAPLQLRIVAAAEQPVPTQTADSAAFADLIERWPDGLGYHRSRGYPAERQRGLCGNDPGRQPRQLDRTIPGPVAGTTRNGSELAVSQCGAIRALAAFLHADSRYPGQRDRSGIIGGGRSRRGSTPDRRADTQYRLACITDPQRPQPWAHWSMRMPHAWVKRHCAPWWTRPLPWSSGITSRPHCARPLAIAPPRHNCSA